MWVDVEARNLPDFFFHMMPKPCNPFLSLGERLLPVPVLCPLLGLGLWTLA